MFCSARCSTNLVDKTTSGNMDIDVVLPCKRINLINRSGVAFIIGNTCDSRPTSVGVPQPCIKKTGGSQLFGLILAYYNGECQWNQAQLILIYFSSYKPIQHARSSNQMRETRLHKLGAEQFSILPSPFVSLRFSRPCTATNRLPYRREKQETNRRSCTVNLKRYA